MRKDGRAGYRQYIHGKKQGNSGYSVLRTEYAEGYEQNIPGRKSGEDRTSLGTAGRTELRCATLRSTPIGMANPGEIHNAAVEAVKARFLHMEAV